MRIRDRSDDIAALSVQGPHSRSVLDAVTGGAASPLRFFGVGTGSVGGVDVALSRTGYTGDLGYELWMPAGDALAVWDRLIEAGRDWGLMPCGLAAMDIARLETGFVLIDVDYVSSESALVAGDRMSPYGLGLGWAVKLGKERFVGREALAELASRPPQQRVVGVALDWRPLESLYLGAGRMPDLPLETCREPVPLYGAGGRHVGRVTTRVWSTLLKKYIGLATVEGGLAEPGRELEMEVTVGYRRERAPARVVPTPFFRPDRMRA